MPSLGADMESGTLVEWLKQPGDKVARGDIIAVVETEKGAIEIEVFQPGVVETLLAKPGQKLAVGAAMAIIRGEPGAVAPPAAVRPPEPPGRPPAAAPPRPFRAQPMLPSEGIRHVRASPAARKRAAELGIDLAKIAGGGPDNVIALADVERAAKAPRPAATMREVIGAAMARSKREIPHYYLADTVNLEPALRWLEAENAKRPVPERMLYAVLMLKASALALRDYREFNGFWSEGAFQASERIHLGVAISLRQGGLIAPAIHDADKLSLPELMAAFRDLVRRARAGGLRSSELSDPTVTVTSLGEQGVESVFPVIYPPQVAIIGFGMVLLRPWVEGDSIVARRLVSCSLAADHRVSDGHRGARFLAAIGRLLQEPEKL